MNTQDLLTYLFNALAFGYVAILLFDLGSRLGGKLLDIFCSTAAPLVDAPAATKSTLRMHNSIPATPENPPSLQPADERVLTMSVPLVVAEERASLLLIPLEVVADPWSVEVELTTKSCCCHTAIATPLPQLLLAPALEVANQPDLATLPNTELRKRCQSAGIKWRNAHGTNKHLSKNQMIK